MKASTDDASPGRRKAERWDETVLVWNGTVARIPASGAYSDSVEEVAEVETGKSHAGSPSER